jgi:hypothetical protein
MPQDKFEGRKIGRRNPIRARLGCAAGGAALIALVVCAGGSARAGDDDVSSSTSVYDKILQTIGVDNSSPNIQYSERSPLVVPPTRDLPLPQANVPPPVADWPHDPDIARRAQAKAKEKPKPHPDYVIESSRPLRPDELHASGAPSGGGTATANADGDVAPPKKSMFDFSFFHKEQYATFTGEPDRTSLTDPPPGYQTPSPDQPYGIGPEQKKYKVPTVADRATLSSGSAQSPGQ